MCRQASLDVDEINERGRKMPSEKRETGEGKKTRKSNDDTQGKEREGEGGRREGKGTEKWKGRGKEKERQRKNAREKKRARESVKSQHAYKQKSNKNTESPLKNE